MNDVIVVPTADEHLAGFHAALDVVARERRYIGLTRAFPLPQTAAFIRQMLQSGGIQVVAVTPDNTVVGWCDIELEVLREGVKHQARKLDGGYDDNVLMALRTHPR